MGDWFSGNSSWKDDNPLGKKSEAFLYEHCQWSIYLRRDERFKCPLHYSDAAKSSTSIDGTYCPKCLGLGVKTSAMIIPARFNLKNAATSLRETNSRIQPGWGAYQNDTADVPRNVKPKLEDFILTVEWDKPLQKVIEMPRGRPLKTLSVWKIKLTADHVERELGWYDIGLEIADHTIDWADSLLPYFKSLPVLRRESWAVDKFW